MPPTAQALTPGITSYIKSLKGTPVEASIEQLISLLKRRQIRDSRPCAYATAHLLLRVVTTYKFRDVGQLIDRIKQVGLRLIAAQPREMVVGNIVRRVLGLIREVVENEMDQDSSIMSDSGANPSAQPHNDSLQRPIFSSHISTFSPLSHGATAPTGINIHPASLGHDDYGAGTPGGRASQRPPLLTSHTSYATSTASPPVNSLFSILSHPNTPSPAVTPPGQRTPSSTGASRMQSFMNDSHGLSTKEVKDDVTSGIREILDELDSVDEQVSEKAHEHIHSNEIILTYRSSATVQEFLLRAAKKRKFTVVIAEAFPNEHKATHATIMNGQKKDDEEELSALTAAGITVILIPDSAVFAIMSRVNKVILATHVVLANGGLVAAAGARMIASAAQAHKTPVIVLSGVYKLSPVYPFDIEELIEYGDASKVVPFEDGEMVDKVDVVNPLFDYVPPDLIDLYITNLGGHAPSYLYRIVADHYRVEDIVL